MTNTTSPETDPNIIAAESDAHRRRFTRHMIGGVMLATVITIASGFWSHSVEEDQDTLAGAASEIVRSGQELMTAAQIQAQHVSGLPKGCVVALPGLVEEAQATQDGLSGVVAEVEQEGLCPTPALATIADAMDDAETIGLYASNLERAAVEAFQAQVAITRGPNRGWHYNGFIPATIFATFAAVATIATIEEQQIRNSKL